MRTPGIPFDPKRPVGSPRSGGWRRRRHDLRRWVPACLAVYPVVAWAMAASAQTPKAEAPKGEVPKTEAPASAQSPATAEARPSSCDAACVRAGAERASQSCSPRIENEAPFDFEWLTRPYGGIFQEADPPAAGSAVVRYKGDSIRFMSPQREWVRITYECAFNSATQRVEGVTVRLGRLNGRGLPPNPQGGRVATAPPQPGGPAAPVALPPPKRKPKPGEPNSIEILQVNPTGR